eukprot:TRINITY_DN20465_c0_g1_i1.p1 TRINITY_DN20465_c0_g1~~TRINITY_DN20465_c0_g1_i1.p1  ORF type:complete len:265 (-),score=69.83 TRINITY_DN20465_c0_g1_i1:376-1170(-)
MYEQRQLQSEEALKATTAALKHSQLLLSESIAGRQRLERDTSGECEHWKGRVAALTHKLQLAQKQERDLSHELEESHKTHQQLLQQNQQLTQQVGEREGKLEQVYQQLILLTKAYQGKAAALEQQQQLLLTTQQQLQQSEGEAARLAQQQQALRRKVDELEAENNRNHTKAEQALAQVGQLQQRVSECESELAQQADTIANQQHLLDKAASITTMIHSLSAVLSKDGSVSGSVSGSGSGSVVLPSQGTLNSQPNQARSPPFHTS